MTATHWVKNGHRWTVSAVAEHAVLAGGAPPPPPPCPATSSPRKVQLGYSTTVHGGQGVTADTLHTVTTGDETRQQLYVALTPRPGRQPPVPGDRHGR